MSDIHNERVILKSANKCCICFRTGIVSHHIKFKSESGGDDFENLAPLCPNCHDRAHTSSTLTKNLTKELIVRFRDEWYNTVEDHKTNLQGIIFDFKDKQVQFISKLKNFYLSAVNKNCFAKINLNIAFSEFIPKEEKLKSIEIFDYVIEGLSDEDQVKNILKKMKELYFVHLNSNESLLKEFKDICKYVGMDYEGL